MTDMITLVCPECRSDNIQLDASAYWNTEAQRWMLDATYGEGWCNDCGMTNIDRDRFIKLKTETKPEVKRE